MGWLHMTVPLQSELPERQAPRSGRVSPRRPQLGLGPRPRFRTIPRVHRCHEPSRSPVEAGDRGRIEILSSLLDALADRVVLFRVGNLVFVTFGLFVALGAAVSLAGAGAILIGQGLTGALFLALALSGSVAVVGGSWLAGLVLDYRLLLGGGWAGLRRPVFVSWGGLIAMPVVLGMFSLLSGFSLLVLLDALARTVPLGHAVGRLGCLCYGCCFGRPTRGRLAITYRNPQAKAVRVAGLSGVRLHPAALYEAVLDVGIFLAVNLGAMLNLPLGMATALALLLYGGGRFWIEFLRDNRGRMVAAFLSLNHLVSLSVAAVGGLAFGAVLFNSGPAPSISWAAGLVAGPWLVMGAVPSGLLMFLGFAAHWRRVGHW